MSSSVKCENHPIYHVSRSNAQVSAFLFAYSCITSKQLEMCFGLPDIGS